MSDTPETETPEAPRPCLAVGALVVDGVRKASLRCALPAGHDAPRAETLCALHGQYCDEATPARPGTPHAVTLEWTDDAAMRDDWPEAYDPAEPVDVDVPMLSDDELEAIARDARVDEAVDADREARAFDE